MRLVRAYLDSTLEKQLRFVRTLVSSVLIFSAAVTHAQNFNNSDEELMTWYGHFLRQAYATGDRSNTSSEQFINVEIELENRGLLTKQIVSDIKRGVVFVGMPLPQALASLDRMQEVDVLIYKGSVIRSFLGPTSVQKGSVTAYDTLISCDDRIVSLFAASGLTTKETYNHTIGSGRIRFQTNFSRGFWTDPDFEPRVRGNRVMDRTANFADRFQHRWSMFSDNVGYFSKPSIWLETGLHNHNRRNQGININDMMHAHIRRTGSVCD